mmetsp:Transcript_64489/g.199971  ORF Transcript_64489/g.199971 Transcript_64489/m.199971 type:complete len:259 (+) Transcript_64489:780-1556(+)
MRSLYSACSACRCSVASATILSSALIPSSSCPISSANVEMSSLAVAIAASSSETLRSRSFFLSSVASNCAAQYSFFELSSSCSFFSTTTMLSIIPRIFSKPPRPVAFLPASATAKRSSPARSPTPAPRRALRTSASARLRRASALAPTCTRAALALGSVFLKSSSASSSFRTLIVSARAASSSVRVALISSHSFVFVPQPFARSARSSPSSARDPCVSSRSLPMLAMETPSSPMRVFSVSICSVRVATSFFLAAMSSP